MRARICVIPLRPDKRAYSCQAVQDGGAPLQRPAERRGDNKLTKNKNKTKAHDWKDKEAKSAVDRKSRSVRQNARGNKNPIRF